MRSLHMPEHRFYHDAAQIYDKYVSKYEIMYSNYEKNDAKLLWSNLPDQKTPHASQR